MRLFACDRCHQLVFFENVACTRCGQALAYLPDRERIGGIAPADGAPEAAPGAPPAERRWRSMGEGGDGRVYRRCRNWTEHAVCNWVVPAEDPNPLCQACRLNLVIPPLSEPAARSAWGRLEAAKRRLVYSLLQLGLPLEPFAPPSSDGGRPPGRPGLGFKFLQAWEGAPVSTGHRDGIITIDVAEADDPTREKVRVSLGEPYRTLLGHFRHEIGHYYWARLVEGSRWLEACRRLFGDDREDYATAVERHYGAGAPPDWSARFVSAYASAHPWEDWAETFAHYLHMVDTLETARAHGLSVRPTPPEGAAPTAGVSARRLDHRRFEDLLAGFAPLTLALNDLNRSMGLADPYPFVLCPAAIEKLRFVHDVVEAASAEA